MGYLRWVTSDGLLKMGYIGLLRSTLRHTWAWVGGVRASADKQGVRHTKRDTIFKRVRAKLGRSANDAMPRGNSGLGRLCDYSTLRQ